MSRNVLRDDKGRYLNVLKDVLTHGYLYREYITNAKGIYEISNDLNTKGIKCNPHSVWEYLKLRGIPTRKVSNAPKNTILFERIYTGYLREMYDSGKSLKEIGDMYGVSDDYVAKSFRKRGIHVRTISESKRMQKQKHFVLSQYVIDYIDGLLLGDGFVNYQIWSGLYEQAFADYYKDWMDKIQEDFVSFGIKTNFRRNKDGYRTINGKTVYFNPTYILISLSYDEFKWFRNRWYPFGIKTIPTDIHISPMMLSNWYMGDGCNVYGTYLNLATNGFDARSTQYISYKLNADLDLHTWVRGNEVFIPHRDMEFVLNYMKPYSVSCFDYKWAYSPYARRNPNETIC